jgi:hypothetical protein
MPILSSDLDELPDRGIISLVVDLYAQITDARKAIASIYDDIRDVLFYVYVHRPNLAIAEISRTLGVDRNTLHKLLANHDGFARMKAKGTNKAAKGLNLPNHQFVHDSNLELVDVNEAVRRMK